MNPHDQATRRLLASTTKREGTSIFERLAGEHGDHVGGKWLTRERTAIEQPPNIRPLRGKENTGVKATHIDKRVLREYERLTRGGASGITYSFTMTRRPGADILEVSLEYIDASGARASLPILEQIPYRPPAGSAPGSSAGD